MFHSILNSSLVKQSKFHSNQIASAKYLSNYVKSGIKVPSKCKIHCWKDQTRVFLVNFWWNSEILFEVIAIGSCKYIKEEVKKLKIVIVDAGTNLSPVALNLSVIANVYAYFEVYVTNL